MPAELDGRLPSLLPESTGHGCRHTVLGPPPARDWAIAPWHHTGAMKAAKALGLTIPPSLLQRAYQVIE